MSTSSTMAAPAATTTTAPLAGVAPSATTAPQPSATAGGMPSAPTTETINPGAWKAGFNEDLRGYIDTKGFKNQADLAEAYRNFEKLQGVPQDKIMKLPESIYDKDGKLTPEGKLVWEKMGAGKDASEYKLPMAEGADPKFVEHFANKFAELGVPKSMAEKITQAFNEFSSQTLEGMKQQLQSKVKESDNTLRQEWGMAYEQNRTTAAEAVRVMGINAQQIDAISSALGHAETMKLFQKLGRSVGESPFISGQSAGSGALEPAQARSQIQALKKDSSFYAKLAAGDSEAKSKWETLHRYAFPG